HFKVTWEGHTLRVQWSVSQTTMLDEDQFKHQLQPEMVHRVMRDLEDQQRRLEKAQRDLRAKELEVEKLRSEPQESFLPTEELSQALQDLYTLKDYWLRATQMVTLLVKQDRMDGQVREAMRRVDWERIVVDTPHIIQRASEVLQSLRSSSTASKRGVAPIRIRENAPTVQNLTLPLDS